MKLNDEECRGIRSRGRWRANSVLTRSKFTTIIAYSFIREYIGKSSPKSSLFSKGYNEEFDNLLILIKKVIVKTKGWSSGENNVNYLEFLRKVKEIYDNRSDVPGYEIIVKKILDYLNIGNLDETIVPVCNDDDNLLCNSIHVFSKEKGIKVCTQQYMDSHGLTASDNHYLLNMLYLSSMISIDDDGRSLFVHTCVSNNDVFDREAQQSVQMTTILVVGQCEAFNNFFNNDKGGADFFKERALERDNRVYRCVYCPMNQLNEFGKDDFDLAMVGLINISDFQKLQERRVATERQFVDYNNCLSNIPGDYVDYNDMARVVLSFVDYNINAGGIHPHVID